MHHDSHHGFSDQDIGTPPVWSNAKTLESATRFHHVEYQVTPLKPYKQATEKSGRCNGLHRLSRTHSFSPLYIDRLTTHDERTEFLGYDQWTEKPKFRGEWRTPIHALWLRAQSGFCRRRSGRVHDRLDSAVVVYDPTKGGSKDVPRFDVGWMCMSDPPSFLFLLGGTDLM